MNRRAFFSAAAGAPVAVAAIAAGSASFPTGYGVLSVRPDDPGYEAWCELKSDKRDAQVFLDGVKQRDTVAVNAHEGWVRRIQRTPRGNLMLDYAAGTFCEEVVYGKIAIVLT